MRGKPARTVLRGPRRGNAPGLPDPAARGAHRPGAGAGAARAGAAPGEAVALAQRGEDLDPRGAGQAWGGGGDVGLFGAEGTALLDALCATPGGGRVVGAGNTGGPRLEPAYSARVVSLRMLLATLEGEIAEFDRRIAAALAGHPGYRTLQQLSGVGPVFAAVFIAEIGDVARFATADKLTCWAGLTPRHRESDTTVHRGRVTKQGSKLVRWAAVEAVQRSSEPAVAAIRTRIADRRGRPGRPGQRTGRNIAKVAAARVLLKLVYYGLRDGQIRALGSTSVPAA